MSQPLYTLHDTPDSAALETSAAACEVAKAAACAPFLFTSPY
ncbi:MAG: hypothetical protein ACOH2H_01800 [Cypionkella sp.]